MNKDIIKLCQDWEEIQTLNIYTIIEVITQTQTYIFSKTE